MRANLFVASALLTLGLVAPAPRAEACSPPPPGVYQTLPATGASWPLNVPVHLFGGAALGDGVDSFYTATVNGQPATLVEVSEKTSLDGSLQVRVEPPPSIGDVVAIAGTFCPAELSCYPIEMEYTVAAEDVAGIDAAPALWFDLHEHAHEPGGSCGPPGTLTWWLHLEDLATQTASESPLIYTVTAFAPGDLSTPVRTWSLLGRGGDEALEVWGDVDPAGVDPAEAFCFRVDVADLAGNPGQSSSTSCAPCRFHADEEYAAGEPAWSSADVYPGGLCADGAVNPTVEPEGEFVGDLETRACQVASAPGAPGGGLLLAAALPLLGLARRRRRRS